MAIQTNAVKALRLSSTAVLNALGPDVYPNDSRAELTTLNSSPELPSVEQAKHIGDEENQ